MGFDGVVITDGLGMAALRRTYTDEQIPAMAILAGADMLLNPPKLGDAIASVVDAVESGEITQARLDLSVRRILELKEKLGLLESPLVNVRAATRIVGSAAHRAVQTSVARAAVTMLATDALLPMPRVYGRSALVTGPGLAALNTVAAALRSRGYATEVLVTGEHPTSGAVSSAVARAAPHDYVVLLTHNVDRARMQDSLADALAATDTPLVTASTGRPYDAGYYDSDADFALYSVSTPSLRAFVAALFGELNPTGKLPVAIPDAADPGSNRYPFGFGLTYP
jgi:beta-N-acetylhexosaminidase